jgi:hypothetical protein
MTGQYPFPTDPGATPQDPKPTPPESPDATHPGPQPPERLARLADLVAGGEVEFPGGLDPDDDVRLAGMVRERLRARLVRFVARQIAHDIHREREAGPLEL